MASKQRHEVEPKPNSPDAITPELDLSLCEREPIHIPGAIQPHGALLAALADRLLVTHASANLASIFGRSAETVLGLPLSDVVGEAAGKELAGAATAGASRQFAISGPTGSRLYLRAHRSGRHICIDVEPVHPEAIWPFTALQSVLESFKAAASRQELLDLAVRGLKSITGYDRVMAYRFDRDGHGEVVAEARARKLRPYLGQRYPASDIPPQARRQYVRQPVGAIFDSSYEPVPLLVDAGLDDGGPLDLTFSSLRSVSPVHREYMRNMRTRASLTIGLPRGETLWGMLICHHMTPHRAGPETRAIATIIGQTASLLLNSLGRAELGARQRAGEAIVLALTKGLAASAPLGELMQQRQAEILQLVGASGAVARFGGALVWLGQTPPRPAAEQAFALLRPGPGGDAVAVDDLSIRYPALADCKEHGSGALLQPLDDAGHDAILWFRPEQARAVVWGGNPAEHAIARREAGRLSPRTSFAAWEEITRGRAEPWTEAELELGRAFRLMVEAEIARRTKTAHDLFHSMFELAPNALMLVGAGGQIKMVNREAERMFGYDRAELRETPVERLVPERFRGGHVLRRAEFMANMAARAIGDQTDLYGLRKDGHEFPIKVGLSAIAAFGLSEEPMVQAIISDISVQRQIERDREAKQRELERSNADLEEFSYAVSHDLKAPLRAIGHLAQWIGEAIKPTAKPETLDDIKLVQERVARMQKLLDGLLEYSRVGHARKPPETFDPAALVREIVSMIDPPPGFVVSYAGEGGSIRTEKVALQVVLENLISNGIKHHDRERGRVDISMRRVDGSAEFRVSDDGPGIPPQFHQRIFAIFQTLKSRDVLEASGIGLSIVKRKIEAHGGKIWVESAPPARGATFVFTWKDSA